MIRRLSVVGGTDVQNPQPPPPPSDIERVLRDAIVMERELVHVVVVGLFADGEIYLDSTFVYHGDDTALLMRGVNFSSELAQEAMASNALSLRLGDSGDEDPVP